MKHRKISITLALIISCGLTVVAQTPQFNIIKPSTTGVPGEEVRVMQFDPAGNLWIAGRFYFWGEAGLAMLSADQLDYQPLPGGGFDTGAWKVWSSVHHPIPSPYINDMVFGAGGVIWIASDGGLTRFDPAAPTEARRWFTYTPANSPLILNDVHWSLSLTWRDVQAMDLSRSQAIKAARGHTRAASAPSMARPGLTSRRRIRH